MTTTYQPPMLRCRFCEEPFYPDMASDLRAHERTCKPWERELDASDCECVYSCADDPATACSLSGDFHVHPEWPCPVHPDAPGDR